MPEEGLVTGGNDTERRLGGIKERLNDCIREVGLGVVVTQSTPQMAIADEVGSGAHFQRRGGTGHGRKRH
jgi:hypothetical protein